MQTAAPAALDKVLQGEKATQVRLGSDWIIRPENLRSVQIVNRRTYVFMRCEGPPAMEQLF